jgi:acyl-CoA hydrolase
VVFVSVDDAGHPRPVPGMVLDNDTDRLRHEQARERRLVRMSKAQHR